jgi:hypothetical protein
MILAGRLGGWRRVPLALCPPREAPACFVLPGRPLPPSDHSPTNPHTQRARRAALAGTTRLTRARPRPWAR